MAVGIVVQALLWQAREEVQQGGQRGQRARGQDHSVRSRHYSPKVRRRIQQHKLEVAAAAAAGCCCCCASRCRSLPRLLPLQLLRWMHHNAAVCISIGEGLKEGDQRMKRPSACR
jgi:hypothetical protein